MICVCIGRGRHKHMMAEHRFLAEENVKLVELRVDYIRSRLDIKRLLKDRPCPCIITCRREQDGGYWNGTEEARIMVLRTAIAEGADYVDLEEDVAGQIPRYGKTKRIVSYHNFRDTPDELYEIHERLTKLDPDIVKIATLTHSPTDNVKMLRLIQDAHVPTIGICMGEIGTPTRILAGKFGAPFTYATFHHDRKLAPGQISYRQMRDIYRYDELNADTEVYGVIADPVAQNMSPLAHNAAFAHFKMNRVYLPFRVPRDELADFLRDGEELGIRGLSVAIPHKEDVLRHLFKSDGFVRGIGAASTLIFEGRDATGYNMDHDAFLDALDTVFHETERGMTLAGRTAMILGAGGISKAIAFGLKRRDATVVIASRTYERSLLLAEKFNCRTVQWYERAKVEPEILINATPVGTHPNVDESPMDVKYLRRGMIVIDTVSNPEQTLLVKQAREQNCRVVTGLEVFARQAAMQFSRFTTKKQDPGELESGSVELDSGPIELERGPIELMRTALKRAIGPANWQG